jgi:hypothetical protein
MGMRVVQRLLAGLLVAGMLLSAGSPWVLAQEQPDLTDVSDSGYVSQEGCTSQPANIERILEIIGDGPATQLASGDNLPLLTGGDIVTGEDADAVRSLMRSLLACMNAWDPLRYLSLFSDSYYQTYPSAVEEALEEAQLQTSATPSPPPLGYGFVLLSESNVFRLDDGRLVYTVALDWSASDASIASAMPEDVLQIVAIQIDGAWLIDDLRFQDYEDPEDCGADCGQDLVATPVAGDGYAGWIMPAVITEANAIFLIHNGDEQLTAFLPTKAEIAEAESRLPAFLQSQDRATDRLIADIATYERQYFGLESESGRFLMINGFCEAFDINPATTIVMVEDGGDCYWFAVYNLDSGEFETLMVNGEA